MNGEETSVVVLRRALPRAARRSNLAPLDFALGPGVHALVGTPADGTLLIAALVGGFEPRSYGQVAVAGRNPGRDPALRAHIGTTLDVPRLPAAKRVADLLNDVDGLRENRASSETMVSLGLWHWADRKLAALSRWDARALELVLALSTPKPLALVLTEPGADIASIDRQELRARLWRTAEAGACVIVVTASTNDAIELAGTIHIFERGRITRWVPVEETGALVPGRGIELRVEADLPRLLVAALADEPSVSGIDWDQEGHRSMISIRTNDLDRTALAVARAASTTGVSIRSISPVAPHLDEVRAAASGLALAAYHAAYTSQLTRDAAARAGASSGAERERS